MLNKEIIAVDIGNSRIKYCFRKSSNAFSYFSSWQTELKNELEKVLEIEPNTKIFYSSVRNDISAILEEIADKSGILAQNIMPFFNEMKPIDYSAIQGIGADRLMSLMGARAFTKGPLATVDCGTAVTVNFLNAYNTVLGGYIFAGAYTQLRALAEKTDALSNIKLKFDKVDPGHSTVDALSAGILASVTGGIKEVISRFILKNNIEDPFRVYFTGGYGREALCLLDMEGLSAQYHRDLVLKGIFRTLEIHNKENI